MPEETLSEIRLLLAEREKYAQFDASRAIPHAQAVTIMDRDHFARVGKSC